MTFEEESIAAFGEIEREAMPVRYELTNRTFSGVIRRTLSESPANEAGFETRTVILIVSDRGQFGDQPIEAPQAGQREVVQVLEGPFLGKWVLTDVNADLAHYHLTCTIAE